jgi:hypothetical protein
MLDTAPLDASLSVSPSHLSQPCLESAMRKTLAHLKLRNIPIQFKQLGSFDCLLSQLANMQSQPAS